MNKDILSPDEAAESLEAIRSVLDRTTRYTHVSWLGVALVGAVGLCGSGGGWMCNLSPTLNPGLFLCLWGGALLAALALGLWATARKARRAREPVLGRKLLLVSAGLFPPIVVAGVLTALLANTGALDLAPGVWMALYGLGILAVAHLLDWEFQLTGWSFIVASAGSFFLLRSSPHASMLVSFGGIHLVLGVFCYYKERPWQRT